VTILAALPIVAEFEDTKTLDRPIAHGVIAGCLLTLAPVRLEPPTLTVRAGTKEGPGPKGPGLRASTYFELRT
jgi:hypothetical protein